MREYLTSAPQATDSRNELRGIDRLHNVILKARGERLGSILKSCKGGHRESGQYVGAVAGRANRSHPGSQPPKWMRQ